MTRKDYVLIAGAIKDALGGTSANPTPAGAMIREEVRQSAAMLMDRLGDDNPRFDRARFAKAAGLVED